MASWKISPAFRRKQYGLTNLRLLTLKIAPKAEFVMHDAATDRTVPRIAESAVLRAMPRLRSDYGLAPPGKLADCRVGASSAQFIPRTYF